MAEPVGRALPRRGEAGGRIPSFPQTAGARAPAPQCRRARERANPRHLGASSPSGNVRGGCRGWTPLVTDDQYTEKVRAKLTFVTKQILPKNPARIPPQTPPARGKSEPRFCEILFLPKK